ncbi:PAS domain S-box protein [Bacillus sp. BRMEA1]|uniref:PAS domain S-box protein n=1 Tax=Neobacillus endophyticus TaxID=2738405 RepID=UPI0015643151|nr:PAS domain S-box protein [Neobacillus endophyticus]NRD80085.1 PAS domain S-box protein [Neobacillus endophyticus]
MKSPIQEIKSDKRQLLDKYITETLSNNQTVFHSNPDAILLLDLEGHILKVNSVFENLSGYTIAESVQLKLQRLFPIESLDKIFHHFHKASLGQVQNFDCFMQTKDEQFVDLNITNIPISVDDKIIGIYAVAKDITHLKRAKAEVRKMEEFHRILTDHVLDIILSTNLLGEILYVSPSIEYILGFTADELIGQHFSMLLHHEDLEKALFERETVLTNLENRRSTFRLFKKDGSSIWVETFFSPIIDHDTRNILEVVSVIRDITERKIAEYELGSRKKAYKDLVEHSPDAVIIAQREKILYINETGANLLGATDHEQILSKSLLDFIHSDYHDVARDRVKKVLEGESTEFKQFRLIRLDHTTFEAEIKGIPTFFQRQTAQYFIIRDITERKKTQELLLNSEKLTIAGQLAAGIAHEVRNPLTAIKGFLQLIESQAEEKAYFEIIQSEMDRIELILSELLVLAKPHHLKFETVNMHSLIDEVKTLIDTQAIMNNVHIEIVNECENLKIKCDKNQLKQVFINFLKNAIEAMPTGGKITIEIKRICDAKVKIFFKDTGIGIPQDILKRIGEPFFTTKGNGTGLGIMISKQIIENHNGSVHFWSDEEGTIIEVIIPIG